MSSLARQSLRNEPPKEACLVAALLRCITKKLVSTNLCLPSSHKGWSCQHWTFCSALGTAKGYRRLHLLCCPLNFQKHLNFNHQMEDVNRAQKKSPFGSRDRILCSVAAPKSYIFPCRLFAQHAPCFTPRNSCIYHPPIG